ncbi:MAG: hypothetical protein HQL37_11720 [Alphaproteobacteria bacterium]|nr:hypothetical protein [Alphaproteobacteria bacterium]
MDRTSSRLLTLEEAADHLAIKDGEVRYSEELKRKDRHINKARLLLLLGTTGGPRFEPMYPIEQLDEWWNRKGFHSSHPLDRFRSGQGCPVLPLGRFNDLLHGEVLCFYRDARGHVWALTPDQFTGKVIVALFEGQEDLLPLLFPPESRRDKKVGWSRDVAFKALMVAACCVGFVDPLSLGLTVDQCGRWVCKGPAS